MKYLKMVGLAAVAAVALMAIIGASSASAAVLCHSTSTPCAQKWPTNTQVQFTLSAGNSGVWQNTSGEQVTTCVEGGEIKGTLSNSGNASETVKVSINTFTWPKCTNGTATIELGQLEIHAIAGSDNGTVTASGFKFTTAIFGVSCVYGFPSATPLGTLTASATGESTLDINTIFLKREGGFLCPESLHWTEQFTQTSSGGTPLYVEPS